MKSARNAELLRYLEERRGELLFDKAHAKIALGRIERELIEVEDAMKDLQQDLRQDLHANNTDKGTIE